MIKALEAERSKLDEFYKDLILELDIIETDIQELKKRKFMITTTFNQERQ